METANYFFSFSNLWNSIFGLFGKILAHGKNFESLKVSSISEEVESFIFMNKLLILFPISYGNSFCLFVILFDELLQNSYDFFFLEKFVIGNNA